MKEIFLATGLVLLASLALLQAWLKRSQRERHRAMETGGEDGVLLFTLPNCPICVRMKQAHGAAIEAGRITLVDIAAQRDFAETHSIRTAPTTLVIRGGKVEQSFYGFVTAESLGPWLQ